MPFGAPKDVCDVVLRWYGSVDDYGDDYGGRIWNSHRYPLSSP